MLLRATHLDYSTNVCSDTREPRNPEACLHFSASNPFVYGNALLKSNNKEKEEEEEIEVEEEEETKDRSASQPASQPTNQPTNQPSNQPTTNKPDS
ncbi:hypothetical protein HZH66_014493 [Vespula vulgaris]|uniref:Uncharacterized protein n=1 Tax=Vespula vulgaris TaxID=7454 RepID=A0A834J1G8_VESVU|nr:hypothetical protein HZH66_014493 [Vespula vulgaris]